MTLPARVLKVQSQRKLNLPARAQADIAHYRLPQQAECAAGSTLRVGLAGLNVCAARSTNSTRAAHGRQREIQTRTRYVEIRAVENVEDLRSEFQIQRL